MWPVMQIIKKYYPVVLTMFCWAISFIWVKIAYEQFNPVNLVTLRILGAAIIFFMFGMFFKRVQPIKRNDLKYFLAMALFEPFLYFMGESHGMLYISSTLAAVIISTIPLFTPIASYYFLKEKITPALFIGIFMSLTGIVVMEFSGLTNGTIHVKGILLMMVAVFSATLFPIFLSKLTANYSTMTILAYQNLFGFIMFLPFFLAFEFKETIQTVYTTRSLMALGGLTLFSSVLAFIFFTKSIKTIGVSKSNAFVNLIPVITAFLAYFILNEQLGINKIIGISIVISGLFLSQIKLKQAKREQ